MIDVFGGGQTAAFVAIAVAYFVAVLAPIWWPAWRAFRSGPPLPRRLLFVGVVAALVYGVSAFFMLVVVLPMSVVRIALVPELARAGVGYSTLLGHVSHLFYQHGWVMIVPVQLLLTWYVTHRLSSRWAQVCAATAEAPPVLGNGAS